MTIRIQKNNPVTQSDRVSNNVINMNFKPLYVFNIINKNHLSYVKLLFLSLFIFLLQASKIPIAKLILKNDDPP